VLDDGLLLAPKGAEAEDALQLGARRVGFDGVVYGGLQARGSERSGIPTAGAELGGETARASGIGR